MDRCRQGFGTRDLRGECQPRPDHPLRGDPGPRDHRNRRERCRRCGGAASAPLAPHRPRDLKALALLGALVFAACNAAVAGPSPTPVPAEKVTFIAGFKPQADLPFVAVYMAQEKGYFRDQSLEVEIQHAT